MKYLLEAEYNELQQARKERDELLAWINSPEIADFFEGVKREIPHQRQRWASPHDAGKLPSDWHWLIAYLAGKALFHWNEAQRLATQGHTLGGEILMDQQAQHHREKALHHTITTAAALANWHAAMTGASTTMRPGVDPAVAWPFPGPAAPGGATCEPTATKEQP